MPDSEIRRATTGRREGRRSLAAYGSKARGLQVLAGGYSVRQTSHRSGRQGADELSGRGAWSAGVALALVYPLVNGTGRLATHGVRIGVQRPPATAGREGAERMKKRPSIRSLETVSPEEAKAYLEHTGGDELNAAYALACERNKLDGSIASPDEAEVHHALFLLCRALGKQPPSFDEMRVELRRRVAA